MVSLTTTYKYITRLNSVDLERSMQRARPMVKTRKLIPFLQFFLFLASSSSSDTLTQSQSLAGNQTLVSAGGKFELGFFTPQGGNKIYLGIWYYNLTGNTNIYVWVANRDSPAGNSSVSLKLRNSGQILLTDQVGSGAVWSSSNYSIAVNPVLQILDSGNLVVREFNYSENYLWQSFDYPTDTLLPGQKLGWDKHSGEKHITSWKSSGDPSSGDYTFKMDLDGDPEMFLKQTTQKLYRSGPWVGQRLSGVPPMNNGPSALNFTFQDTPGVEVYYEVSVVDPTIMTRAVLEPDGVLRRYNWGADTRYWNLYWYSPKDQCDQYNTCGAYGVCDATRLFVCVCPHGFVPRDTWEWAQRDGSSGCARRTGLDCGTDGFGVLRDMKVPESGEAKVFRDKGLDECREMCRKDCNCTAFANWRVVNGVGTGCLMWVGDLKDMRMYTESASGQNLHIRLAASELGSDKTRKVIIGVGVSAGGVMLLIAIVSSRYACKRKRSSASKLIVNANDAADDLELPLYDFEDVVAATNNFSFQNKLGEGGFGQVYKGVLKEGQVVAIKRLSRESGQGAEEFKNEVKLIAKLQHRNLVRLLGCCIEGEEKILIYEYLPNRSLDTLLFAAERRSLLDWKRRFNIICGIAKGLQYLHHDSRFRIIHRDFKASNILLDHDMNPKISDFGVARLIFGGDETGAKNTRRVVGTYGYMAPEYAMDGVFSIKSDVFSFGVLVLELVTGKKNTAFFSSDDDLNLLGYAWKGWKEGKGRELVDESIGDSYSEVEMQRCIQIGLLCVQERAEERPTMSSVVVALSSESAPLPYPKLPGFCLRRRHNAGVETDSSSSHQMYDKYDNTFSVNEVTNTLIHGR